MSRPPYLRVENLSVTFHAEPDPIEAVRRISFQVNEGETLAIVGESGSITTEDVSKVLEDSAEEGVPAPGLFAVLMGFACALMAIQHRERSERRD